MVRELRATPSRWRRAVKGATEEQLARPPAAGAWSALEVLAHLRGAADVQGGWILRMLAEDTPTIRYVSARSGMRRAMSSEPTVAGALRSFARQREELVEALVAAGPDGWTRTATFTGVQGGWSPTVLVLAHGLVGHEASHADQLAAAAGG